MAAIGMPSSKPSMSAAELSAKLLHEADLPLGSAMPQGRVDAFNGFLNNYADFDINLLKSRSDRDTILTQALRLPIYLLIAFLSKCKNVSYEEVYPLIRDYRAECVERRVKDESLIKTDLAAMFFYLLTAWRTKSSGYQLKIDDFHAVLGALKRKAHSVGFLDIPLMPSEVSFGGGGLFAALAYPFIAFLYLPQYGDLRDLFNRSVSNYSWDCHPNVFYSSSSGDLSINAAYAALLPPSSTMISSAAAAPKPLAEPSAAPEPPSEPRAATTLVVYPSHSGEVRATVGAKGGIFPL